MSGLGAKSKTISILVLAALGLSACGEGLYAVRRDQGWEQPQPATSPQARSTPPASDDQSSYTPSPPNPTVGDGAPIAAGSGGYYAQRGDTLYSIARRSGVPVRTIIDTNQLQPPYQLVIGQHLILPQTNTYVVVAGDTLYSISRRMHVGTSELTQANQLQPPYAVHTGQVLVIPGDSSAGGPPGAPVVTSTAPVGGQGPLPPNDGSSIQVTPLAPPPGVPSSNVPGAPLAAAPPQVGSPPPPPDQPPPPPASRPPASSGPAFYADPQVQRPDAAVSPPATTPTPGVVPPPIPTPPLPTPPLPTQAVTTPAPNATTPLPSATAVPAAPSPAETQTASAAPPVLSELASPPARGGKKFLWPVKGRVVGTFGEQAKGLHNDGINVVAPKGTVVHAAENGVVAYAGNELRGFGNLLLIRHADGFMTAYAHNDELLVQRGDTVTRGQAIAKVGATGSVTEPQLHFEVRKGGQPVDPEQYLTAPGDS